MSTSQGERTAAVNEHESDERSCVMQKGTFKEGLYILWNPKEAYSVVGDRGFSEGGELEWNTKQRGKAECHCCQQL